MRRRDACLLLAGAPAALTADFASNWPANSDQIWLGPEYWANRLQDWRLRNGRIEAFDTAITQTPVLEAIRPILRAQPDLIGICRPVGCEIRGQRRRSPSQQKACVSSSHIRTCRSAHVG